MSADRMSNGSEETVDVDWSWQNLAFTWWEIMDIVSSVLGTIGNLLVIMVLTKRRASNRFTDTLILALAQADFLTSIFMFPLPKAKTVPSTPLGAFYCKMTLPGFCLFVCYTASIYILMSISVERFIAVVYPLQFNRLVSRRHFLSIVIATVWLCSFVVYLGFVTTVVQVDPDQHLCTLKFGSQSGQLAFGCFMVAYRLIIPASVMLCTQIAIACSLHRQSKRFRDQAAAPFHVKARNRVLKLMLVVIVIYVVCVGPSQVFIFLYSVRAIPASLIGGPYMRFVIAMASYNSCLNPVVYAAWYPRFRRALKDMFTFRSDRPSVGIFTLSKMERAPSTEVIEN